MDSWSEIFHSVSEEFLGHLDAVYFGLWGYDKGLIWRKAGDDENEDHGVQVANHMIELRPRGWSTLYVVERERQECILRCLSVEGRDLLSLPIPVLCGV